MFLCTACPQPKRLHGVRCTLQVVRCPNRCAAAQSARASCERSRATERQVACRRLLSQVQTVVWSGRSEYHMPQCGRARLAGRPPACGEAAVVLRGPVWPRLVRHHSELGADGRCKAAWLLSSLATSGEVKLRFVSLHGTGGPRTSTSTVEAHPTSARRDAAMGFARIPLHWHADGRSSSTVAGRVANAVQRKRPQIPTLVHHAPLREIGLPCRLRRGPAHRFALSGQHISHVAHFSVFGCSDVT